jgi:PBSX family phage portal protein
MAKREQEAASADIVRVLSLTGKQVEGSNLAEDDPFSQAQMYGRGGKYRRRVLTPPLGEGSLSLLVDIVSESNILPQCIEAYEQNIDGFGHRFDALTEEEEPQQGGTAIENRAELEKLEEFFTYAYSEGSFIKLRRRTRQDIETTGFGVWEILRNAKDEIFGLNHAPSYTMRMTALDPQLVPIEEQRRIGRTIRPVKLARRFRVFCQIHYAAGREEVVWFKEFGDPRTLNRKTGEWNAKGDRSQAASEMVAFTAGYYPKSPYSIPRWMGNLPSVLGSRASEEVNLLYFDNKAIPPLVVTVSGGVLTKGTITRIKDTFRQLKGRTSFHDPLILEADQPDAAALGRGATSAARIEVKPMSDALQRDAMFMGYDDGNRRKGRSSMRLPPIMTGETDDYTRATADTSMLTTEEQVFRPERMDFDFWVNRWMMPGLGARFYKFVSNGPNVTLNEDLIAVLTSAEGAGAMTPNIAREILADVLERKVPRIKEDWGDLPFSLTLAQFRTQLAQVLGLPTDGQPPAEPPADEPAKRAAAALLAKRLPPLVKEELIREIRRHVRKELDDRRRRAVSA